MKYKTDNKKLWKTIQPYLGKKDATQLMFQLSKKSQIKKNCNLII